MQTRLMKNFVAVSVLFQALAFGFAANAESILIRNASVTGTGTTDILVVDGVIKALQQNLVNDSGVEEFNAAGSAVTPGFIDSGTPLGLGEVENAGQTKDNAARGVNLSAGFDTSLAINRRSSMINIAPNDGVTTAIVVPTPGEHIFAGISSVLTTGDERTVTGGNALHVFIDESHRKLSGGSRGAVMQQLVVAFAEAKRFDKNRRAYESGRIRNFEYSLADLETLSAVLKQALPLVVHVDRAGDIENLLVSLQPYNLKLVIAGATEAWKVADLLAEASVPVVLNVLENRPRNFDQLGARLDNAALLAEAGVTVAFMTTEAFTDFRSLAQAAGVATAYGMPKAEAIRAITANPATIWGLPDRGSLSVGARADLVIWDGDPLEVTSAPVRVMVDGEWVNLRTRQDMLRDRYSDLNDRSSRFGYR